MVAVRGRQLEGQPRQPAAGDEHAHGGALVPLRVQGVQLVNLLLNRLGGSMQCLIQALLIDIGHIEIFIAQIELVSCSQD